MEDQKFIQRLLDHFCNVGQLIASIKGEWESENSWSEWDQEQLEEHSSILKLLYEKRDEPKYPVLGGGHRSCEKCGNLIKGSSICHCIDKT